MVQEVELWTNRISLLLSDHLEISNILGNSNDLIHAYIHSHINTYIHKYTYGWNHPGGTSLLAECHQIMFTVELLPGSFFDEKCTGSFTSFQ